MAFQYIVYPAVFSGGGGVATTEFQEFSGPAAGGTIAGARNGINKVYTLSHTPVAASLLLWVSASGPLINGVDFTIAGAVITLAAGTPAPIVTDTIFADYDY